MKKILAIISVFTFSFFTRPLHVFGANLGDAFPLSSATSKEAGYNTTSASLETILSQGVTIILSLLGVIFIAMIIYGGVIWMTANGNEQKIQKASDTIKESFIGLIVVLAAYAISYFLFSIFGGQLAGNK